MRQSRIVIFHLPTFNRASRGLKNLEYRRTHRQTDFELRLTRRDYNEPMIHLAWFPLPRLQRYDND